MYIDIGASDREEAERLVQIGDVAVYHSLFSASNENILGAMDDRVDVLFS